MRRNFLTILFLFFTFVRHSESVDGSGFISLEDDDGSTTDFTTTTTTAYESETTTIDDNERFIEISSSDRFVDNFGDEKETNPFLPDNISLTQNKNTDVEQQQQQHQDFMNDEGSGDAGETFSTVDTTTADAVDASGNDNDLQYFLDTFSANFDQYSGSGDAEDIRASDLQEQGSGELLDYRVVPKNDGSSELEEKIAEDGTSISEEIQEDVNYSPSDEVLISEYSFLTLSNFTTTTTTVSNDEERGEPLFLPLISKEDEGVNILENRFIKNEVNGLESFNDVPAESVEKSETKSSETLEFLSKIPKVVPEDPTFIGSIEVVLQENGNLSGQQELKTSTSTTTTATATTATESVKNSEDDRNDDFVSTEDGRGTNQEQKQQPETTTTTTTTTTATTNFKYSVDRSDEFVPLDDDDESTQQQQQTATTTTNGKYSVDNSGEFRTSEDILIEIIPLPKPEIPVPENTTLYRFVFPASNPDDDLDKFKYNWIEEQVLVNDGGVPKECSVHVDKTKQKHMAIIEELLKAKTELDNLKLKLSQTQQVQLPLEQAARTNLRLRLTQNISVTLVLNNTEKAVLESTEDLSLEMESQHSFITFARQSQNNEEPTLTKNDWFEINSPEKNKIFSTRNISNNTLIAIICDESPECHISLETKAVLNDVTTAEMAQLVQDQDQEQQQQQQTATTTTITAACECPACDESCLNSASEDKLSMKFMVKEATIQFSLKSCDSRCSLHGQCINGTCQCSQGWNGRHCTLPGCQNKCHQNGECIQGEASLWKCSCLPGWEGEDCSQATEQDCTDKKDNDGDGLVDCEDPECCISTPECQGKQVCTTVEDPANLVKNPDPANPGSYSSFWERIKFLVHESLGIQRYAKIESFDTKNVCVLRGRIVTRHGRGIVGVRISREFQLSEGFTLSRKDGYFDFVATCDKRRVELTFGKSPYQFMSKSFNVIPNQINYIGEILHEVSTLDQTGNLNRSCSHHLRHFDLSLKVITKESSQKVEEISFEDSPLKLVYNPDLQPGLNLNVSVGLTNGNCSEKSLTKIIVSLLIEGRAYEQILEPEPNLEVSFTWNGTDAFGQTVFGEVNSILKVGLDFNDCEQTIWESRVVILQARDPHLDDFAGWNLNLHHRFEPQSGLIYLGSGQRVDLKSNGLSPRSVQSLYETVPEEAFSPVAVEVDERSEWIFVGTQKEIRLISLKNGTSTVIFQIDSKSSGTRYYLSFNSDRRTLFVSFPNEKIVIGKQMKLDTTDAAEGWFILAGNGKPCLGNKPCGDGGLAVEANLAFPKGIASSEDKLYLADGHRIRVIDLNTGLITTFAGKTSLHWGEEVSGSKPVCSGFDSGWKTSLPDHEFDWPTDLSVNPVDESVYVLDNSQILSLSSNGDVFQNCITSGSLSSFETVKSISFSREGQLYFVASNHNSSQDAIFQIDSFGKMEPILIRDDLKWISDLSVLNNGVVLISEPDEARLRLVSRGRFQQNELGQFVVPWPQTDQVFIFSETGLHLETRSLFTDALLLQFSYEKSKKRLTIVKDQNSFILIERSSDRIEMKVNNQKVLTHALRISDKNKVDSVELPSGKVIRFFYQENGLLQRQVDNTGRSLWSSGIEVSPAKEDHKRCLPNNYNMPIVCEDKGRQVSINFKNQVFPRRNNPDDEHILIPDSVEVQSPEKLTTIGWSFYVRLKSRTFDIYSGAGKHFKVDGKTIFSTEIHPRSGIQSLYDEEGKQILSVEEFYIPARRIWIPIPPLTMVDERFDLSKKIISWKWGNNSETYSYDAEERLDKVIVGGKDEIKYVYDQTNFPKQVILPNGGTFHLLTTETGQLKSIMTPEGHIHNWAITNVFGKSIFRYLPPWSVSPFQFVFRDSSFSKPDQIVAPNGDFLFSAIDKRGNEVTCGNLTCRKVTVDNNITSVQIVTPNGDLILQRTKINDQKEMVESEIEIRLTDDRNFRSTVERNFVDSTIEVKVSTENKSSSLFVVIDPLTSKVFKVDQLVYDQSAKSTIIQDDRSSQFLYITEKDENGREKSRTIISKGEVIFHQLLTYSDRNQVTRQTMRTKQNVVNGIYTYNKDGQLELHDEGTFFQWKHQHDKSGNVINVDFGIGNSQKEFEFGDRVSNIAGNDVHYDANGRQIGRHNLTFVYDDFSQLVEIKSNGGESLSKFYYDVSGRVCLQICERNSEILTFFYAREDQPNLMTHIHSSKRGMKKLQYDDKLRLISVSSDSSSDLLYVATDIVGTPRFVLSPIGEIISQPLRTPFGASIEQPLKDDPLWIPLGFQGGIEDTESGIVILQGRKPYDSHLGQWMIPQLENILSPDLKNDPNSVFLYRFANNDPINSEFLTRTFSYMDKLDDWLSVFCIDPPSKYLNGLGLPAEADLFGRTEIEQRIPFVYQRRRPKLFSEFYSDPPIFGGNISLVVIDNVDDKVNIEEPEFFHRKVLAKKVSDGKGFDALIDLIDQAILMSPNLTHPSEMNLFISKIIGNEVIREIVDSMSPGSVTQTSLDVTTSPDAKFLLELKTEKVGLKLWIGFTDVKSAELFRHDFTTTITTTTNK